MFLKFPNRRVRESKIDDWRDEKIVPGSFDPRGNLDVLIAQNSKPGLSLLDFRQNIPVRSLHVTKSSKSCIVAAAGGVSEAQGCGAQKAG